MKKLFFDMDGVLADFESGLAKVDDDVMQDYEGHYDEIPGLFSLMSPIKGSIDAVNTLAQHYDVFILSTAPWKNPSAWSDKRVWVEKYFKDVFHKRMIITHRKDLAMGDYLIDDRGKNGTSEFSGEWIQFGSEKFPDWPAVISYLSEKDGWAVDEDKANYTWSPVKRDLMIGPDGEPILLNMSTERLIDTEEFIYK